MLALRALLCLLYGSVLSVEMSKNPIRKVVTLMQNMQKEVEAEGEKSKELHEKFLCYCKDSYSTLSKSLADASAAADEFSSKVKAETAQKTQLAQEIGEHKKDREAAKGDLEEATSLRNKEAAEFAASKADSETNIAAMGSAIPAIESGMSGAAFMQMPAAPRLRQLVDSYANLEAMDRRDLVAFLDRSGDYTPSSGQIVGILKQMKDEFEANLKAASEEEATAVAGFKELSAEKAKEIEVATSQIESKMARSGSLAVSIVQAKDGFDDNSVAAEDSSKTMSSLKEQCAAEEKEYSSASKDRADEVAALSEAISVLNDDDALDVFKKAVPELIQEVPASFLQRTIVTKSSKAQKALHAIQGVSAKASSTQLGLMLLSLKSKLSHRHTSGSHKFEDIAKMIDAMISLLGKQQDEDDKQKEWCRVELDQAGDDEAAAQTKLSSVEAALAENSDAVATVTDEIGALTSEVTELDKTVADATVQRKEEHQSYVEAINMQSAAIALIGKAKKKLEKFYKPALVQSPVSFVQIRSSEWSLEDSEDLNQEVQDEKAQEAAQQAQAQRNAAHKGDGVISLMDHIIHQTEMASKDSENAEKKAQEDYAKMMADAQDTRAADVKSISDKNVAKAGLEKEGVDAKEKLYLVQEGLLNIGTMTADLHSACDFLVQNYDLRKEARTNELDSLKNAKVILTS